MKNQWLIVNGYRVPNGYGGVAVRRACELITAQPGIPQTRVLSEALRASDLNASTSGWITSPGPKSPAGILWERHKEGVFRCYPNEFTSLVSGAREHLDKIQLASIRKLVESTVGFVPMGTLVKVTQDFPDTVDDQTCMFLGWRILQRYDRSHRFVSLQELDAIVKQLSASRPSIVAEVLMDGSTRQIFLSGATINLI